MYKLSRSVYNIGKLVKPPEVPVNDNGNYGNMPHSYLEVVEVRGEARSGILLFPNLIISSIA